MHTEDGNQSNDHKNTLHHGCVFECRKILFQRQTETMGASLEGYNTSSRSRNVVGRSLDADGLARTEYEIVPEAHEHVI